MIHHLDRFGCVDPSGFFRSMVVQICASTRIPPKIKRPTFGDVKLQRSCNRWFTRWFTSSEWPQMCLQSPWALEKQNNVACRSDAFLFQMNGSMFEIDVPLPKWILIFSRILGSHELVCEMIFLRRLRIQATSGETCNVRSGKLNFLVAYLMRCQEPGIYCRCISTWALTTCKTQIFPQNP